MPRPTTYKKALSERDVRALRWIGEQYAVRLDQVQKLLSRERKRNYVDAVGQERELLGVTTVRDIVTRWKVQGYVEYAVMLAGEPYWIWLTRKGLAYLSLPHRERVPKVGNIEHYRYVNDVRLANEVENPLDIWISERTLKRQGDTNERTRRHLVDAEIHRYDDGHLLRIGVEVELTPKKPDDLLAIVGELAITYDFVWYYTKPEAHEGVLRSIRQLARDVHDQFEVIPLSALE